MTNPRPASLRPAAPASLALVVIVLAACSSADPTPSVATSPSPVLSPSATTAPTASPSPEPTPAPTPKYTNEPDDELAGLVPAEANGVPVVVAPFDEFALTPGDIGAAYGDIGARFSSLALAYVEQPRATLYLMRVDGEPVTTAELEPHLATAGRYVGIAGLDPEPWTRDRVDGTRVWVRPEDNATALGTMIYTWSSGEFVFLLIGVDDAVNRAIVAALPGERAPAPTAPPSASPGASDAASPSPSEES